MERWIGHDERNWKYLTQTDTLSDLRNWRVFRSDQALLVWHKGMSENASTYHQYRGKNYVRKGFRKCGINMEEMTSVGGYTELDPVTDKSKIRRIIKKVQASADFQRFSKTTEDS